MKENLLPYYYKSVALTIGVLSIIALILKYVFADELVIQQERLGWIIKIIFLISLLILAFSKEKNESEEIGSLRLKEFKSALAFGVFVLVFDAFQELLFWDGNYEMKNGYEIMLGILIFHLVLFNYRKIRLKDN